MGLNDPLRSSSWINAFPTDPDAPRTTATRVLDIKCLSSTRCSRAVHGVGSGSTGEDICPDATAKHRPIERREDAAVQSPNRWLRIQCATRCVDDLSVVGWRGANTRVVMLAIRAFATLTTHASAGARERTAGCSGAGDTRRLDRRRGIHTTDRSVRLRRVVRASHRRVPRGVERTTSAGRHRRRLRGVHPRIRIRVVSIESLLHRRVLHAGLLLNAGRRRPRLRHAGTARWSVDRRRTRLCPHRAGRRRLTHGSRARLLPLRRRGPERARLHCALVRVELHRLRMCHCEWRRNHRHRQNHHHRSLHGNAPSVRLKSASTSTLRRTDERTCRNVARRLARAAPTERAGHAHPSVPQKEPVCYRRYERAGIRTESVITSAAMTRRAVDPRTKVPEVEDRPSSLPYHPRLP